MSETVDEVVTPQLRAWISFSSNAHVRTASFTLLCVRLAKHSAGKAHRRCEHSDVQSKR